MFTSTRGRKKKALTDPVQILPFKNQSLRKEKKSELIKKIEGTKIKKPEAPLKPKSKPVGKKQTGHLSIINLLEKELEKKNKKFEDLPKDSYSEEQLNMLWRKYAFVIKEKGLETFYNALIKRFPKKINDFNYQFELDNKIQVEYIRVHLDEFHQYLRKQLNNYSIIIELIVTEAEDTSPKFLNSKEKYDVLSGKNPNLIYLKNSLDLDIEF